MGFRQLSIDGIPDGVIVRASTRRRKTVTAFRENGMTVVVVPAHLAPSVIRTTVVDLVAKLQAPPTGSPRTDAQLQARAEALRLRYVPEAPTPRRVVWSTRQRQRWGSCTPEDRSIRISALLQDMPGYVIDSVIVHELAHLLHIKHDAAFWNCVRRYEQLERAQAFLAGYSHARAFSGESGCPPLPHVTPT